VHLSAVDSLEPSHSVLGKLLNLGLQLVALHIKIIHSTNPWNQLSRVPATDSVHQRSTNRAEVISHCAARGDGAALSIFSKLVLAADMRRSRLVNDEVGREC
jgi:N-acetylglucosamine kinase-like BadF-type ATPase